MEQKQIYNILFCGTGGQGVLKASEVCGVAALKAGYRVKKSEVHGMAQRGGSVESHLRFGQDVASPLIMPHQADFLVSFFAAESDRLRHFLKDGGIDLTRFLEQAGQLQDKRFVNTFFLGILAARLPIDKKFWFEAIEEVVGKRVEENKKVFEEGYTLSTSSK